MELPGNDSIPIDSFLHSSVNVGVSCRPKHGCRRQREGAAAGSRKLRLLRWDTLAGLLMLTGKKKFNLLKSLRIRKSGAKQNKIAVQKKNRRTASGCVGLPAHE
jgi:hypothetical protein